MTTISRPIRCRVSISAKAATTSLCPWQGKANYYTVVVGGKENPDAAWYYSNPNAAAANIAGKVAFWKGVTVVS